MPRRRWVISVIFDMEWEFNATCAYQSLDFDLCEVFIIDPHVGFVCAQYAAFPVFSGALDLRLRHFFLCIYDWLLEQL